MWRLPGSQGSLLARGSKGHQCASGRRSGLWVGEKREPGAISSGMDQFGQTSRHGGRAQTDYQTPPESQAELPGTLRPSSSCWTKREHDGGAEAPCKSQRTSCNAIEATVVLDDTQRKVLEELVTCVDANASIVITNPRAKGAANPSPATALSTDYLHPPSPGRASCCASPCRALCFAGIPCRTLPWLGPCPCMSPHPAMPCCGRQSDCLRDRAVADYVRLHV
jgi:hypothetical protein